MFFVVYIYIIFFIIFLYAKKGGFLDVRKHRRSYLIEKYGKQSFQNWNILRPSDRKNSEIKNRNFQSQKTRKVKFCTFQNSKIQIFYQSSVHGEIGWFKLLGVLPKIKIFSNLNHPNEESVIKPDKTILPILRKSERLFREKKTVHFQI